MGGGRAPLLRRRLRSCRRIYGETGSRTDEAEARLRSGGALLAAGRRSEGEAEMARALAFYNEVGATYFVRRAEGLLAAAGSEIPA
ncbi:hypothetical protein BH20ACT13_BH20ACT13_19370 [soil metagenome]